jgi:hypothetical protein
MENRINFTRLIKEYSIKIPIIQRDYVQGRNNPLVINARNNLLSDIKASIEDQIPINLNFVYGKTNDEIFIPLDGQQRLTTLFIMYFYAYLKEENFTNIEVLKRFSYDTRFSSKEFIKALVSNAKTSCYKTVEPLSNQVMDNYWFRDEWRHDPTIGSILIMIDAVHEYFKDFDNLSDKLDSCVSFFFLDIDNLGMEDSLYVKLNARGKPLTDFENFKASLEGYIIDNVGKYSVSFPKDFFWKIDNEWTDFFWKIANLDFDRSLMKFFHLFLWSHWFEKQQVEYSQEYHMQNYAMGNFKNITIKGYIDSNCIDEQVLTEIYYTLDYLSKHLDEIVQSNDFEEFKRMLKKEGLSFEERVNFFGIVKYLGKNRPNRSQNISSWLRILTNLSRNTIYNRTRDMMLSIQAISQIINSSDNPLEYFANTTQKITGFFGEQIEEERIKAKLMTRYSSWKKTIMEAEGVLSYFRGQIYFLFFFSGIDYNSASNLDNVEYYLNIFNKYYAHFKFLFNQNGYAFSNEDYLFHSALLAFGDYLIPLSTYHCFVVNSDRDTSWKRFLQKNYEKKNIYLKQLLDNYHEAHDSRKFLDYLRDTINQFNVLDWRWHFVKQMLSQECGNKRRIRKSLYGYDEGKILLLSSSTSSGYNNEAHLMALRNWLRDDSNENIVKSVKLYPDRGMNGNYELSMYINGEYCTVIYKKFKDKIFEMTKGGKIEFYTFNQIMKMCGCIFEYPN